ncbi:MAG: hydantoinase/oxoprolinase family protein, partial [Burkholderiaceae bacterium]|nr:hydantoinase/oxoprolinase family protein [Burkholderiaceae bacterium]
SSGTRTLLTKGKGRVAVPVYQLNALNAGDQGAGPAIIEEDFFTCRVLDGWSFVISDAGDILLNKKG